MVCDDRWCSGYGKHEYDPDQCPLHTWPPKVPMSFRERVWWWWARARMRTMLAVIRRLRPVAKDKE